MPPSKTSQQSTSFKTKQKVTKSVFGECSIQNVKIVVNGSSSEIQSILQRLWTVVYFLQFVHNSAELFHRLLGTDLRKKCLMIFQDMSVVCVLSVVMNKFSRAYSRLLSCKITQTFFCDVAQ